MAKGGSLTRLALRQFGEGARCLLWVHGYTLDSTIWDSVWKQLPQYRHVGVDLPGHGNSPWSESTSLQAIARQVLDAAEAVDARDIVGMSFGGLVSIAAAIEGRSWLRSVTLASPALGGGPQDPESMQCNLELQRLAKEQGLGPWLIERWMACPPRIFEGARRDPALFQRLQQVVTRHRFEELNTGVMRELTAATQSPKSLAKLGVPVLLLIGEEDMESFKRTAELLRRAVPRCKRRYIDGAVHMALLERPEPCAELIRKFLAEG